MWKQLFAIIAVVSNLVTPVGADFHIFVQNTYRGTPFSIATYNPQNGQLGRISLAPLGGSAVGSPDGSEIWILGLRISPGGCNEGGYISIYDVATRSNAANLPVPGYGGLCSPNYPVGLFSPDGKSFYAVISGLPGTTFVAYNVANRSIESETVLPSVGIVASMAISSSGTQLFLTDRVNIYEVDSATSTVTGKLAIRSTVLASAGKTLLASGGDGVIYVDMATFIETSSVPTLAGPTAISVSADGSIAVLNEKNPNTLNGSYVQTLNVSEQSITTTKTLSRNVDLILSPDASTLTVVNSGSYSPPTPVSYATVETWDPQDYTVLEEGKLFDGALAGSTYAGSTLYLYFYSSLVTVVDGSSQAVTQRIPVGGGSQELTSAPGGKLVYAFNSGALDVLIAGASQPIPSLAFSFGIGATFTSFAVSNVGWYALTSSPNDPVVVIDPANGKGTVLPYPGFSQPQNCFNSFGTPLISPNEKGLALSVGYLCGAPPYANPGSQPPTEGVALYSIPSNVLTAQLQVSNYGPIGFSADSANLYVVNNINPNGSGETQISVIDVSSGTVANVWSFASDPTFGQLAASPDGKTLYASASIGGAGAIFVIDTATGVLTNQFPLETVASNIALSPDGSKLLIVGFGGTQVNDLGIMDTATGTVTYVDTGYPALQVVATK